MSLMTIRLELARTPDHPDGNPNHGYEFHAPLTDDFHLDDAAWRDKNDLCTVRKFEDDLEDEHGVLIHSNDHGWSFSYVPDQDEDDEPLFKFGGHVIQPDEYLSVTEHDEVQRTFRIVSVSPYL